MSLQTTRLAIEGQGLVEYALIILLVAIAIVAVVTGLGQDIADSITSSGEVIP